MSEPFVGEIRMFAGNFAPRGWAYCNGQLLAISQNNALFSLLGTIYGGNGRITFGLPDLRGRIPIHAGSGPGLTPRALGTKSGAENVILNTNQLPSHSHNAVGTSDTADAGAPAGNLPAASTTIDLYTTADPSVDFATGAIQSTGGGQSHSNLMPFLCINFIIALVGIFPSRD